jgi:hypothetical protein
MHKSKVAVGIGIMGIGTIFLLIEIGSGINQEMTYQVCIHNTAPLMHQDIPCHNFLDYVVNHIRSIITYVGVLGLGVWIFVFGVKSISLRSFSRE